MSITWFFFVFPVYFSTEESMHECAQGFYCSVSTIVSMLRQMTSRTECVSLSHPLHVTTNEAVV